MKNYLLLLLMTGLPAIAAEKDTLILQCMGKMYHHPEKVGEDAMESSPGKFSLVFKKTNQTIDIVFARGGNVTIPYKVDETFYHGSAPAELIIEGRPINKVGFSLNRVDGSLSTSYYPADKKNPWYGEFSGICEPAKVKF